MEKYVYVYSKICKGMYSISQRYCPTQTSPWRYTPGLWNNKWQPVTFHLVVNDLLIKYVGGKYAEHLSLKPTSIPPNRTHNWVVVFCIQSIGYGSIMLFPINIIKVLILSICNILPWSIFWPPPHLHWPHVHSILLFRPKFQLLFELRFSDTIRDSENSLATHPTFLNWLLTDAWLIFSNFLLDVPTLECSPHSTCVAGSTWKWDMVGHPVRRRRPSWWYWIPRQWSWIYPSLSIPHLVSLFFSLYRRTFTDTLYTNSTNFMW